MEKIKEWNGRSVSFFGKLEDIPIPIPALLSPIRLFNIVFNQDGSLYTNYFGTCAEVATNQVIEGTSSQQIIESIPSNKELRISIHGSGQVRSFNRGANEQISHLGVELRAINQPILLAQHRLGTAGAYMHDLLDSTTPRASAKIIPGLFEQPLRPVFQIHVSPEGLEPHGPALVWSGLTRQMDNGKKLVFAVSLIYEPWNSDESRDHEIRVFAAPKLL